MPRQASRRWARTIGSPREPAWRMARPRTHTFGAGSSDLRNAGLKRATVTWRAVRGDDPRKITSAAGHSNFQPRGVTSAKQRCSGLAFGKGYAKTLRYAGVDGDRAASTRFVRRRTCTLVLCSSPKIGKWAKVPYSKGRGSCGPQRPPPHRTMARPVGARPHGAVGAGPIPQVRSRPSMRSTRTSRPGRSMHARPQLCNRGPSPCST